MLHSMPIDIPYPFAIHSPCSHAKWPNNRAAPASHRSRRNRDWYSKYYFPNPQQYLHVRKIDRWTKTLKKDKTKIWIMFVCLCEPAMTEWIRLANICKHRGKCINLIYMLITMHRHIWIARLANDERVDWGRNWRAFFFFVCRRLFECKYAEI